MNKFKSMTGFGCFQEHLESFHILWEIKSVNGRTLDIKWRLPISVRSFENVLEKKVRSYASRGRVDISLTLQDLRETQAIQFDEAQAKQMLTALAAFAESQGDTFVPDYMQLMKSSFLWGQSELPAEGQDVELLNAMQKSLNTALADWTESKEKEGKELAKDFLSRIERMEVWIKVIEEHAPAIKEARFITVRERLTETLANLDSNLTDARFLQEIVILSDKLDVSEEITRLYAHFVRIKDIMEKGEDVGRKLDFTLQECFREINTCGNKIQDSSISRIVVDFKNELEKCREQVQNLE